MKKTLKYGVMSFTLLLLFSFSSPERKIEKLISKIWKDIELTLQEINLDQPIEKVTLLKGIYTNGELLGYACYTNSHGCKVGGCSAPEAITDDSYEVFDYIVIYDKELAILKVDIANYGGEYGYEICRSNWLKQFNGSTNGFVLGENVDGISGATVSASYLIDDLNKLGKNIKRLKLTKQI